jgi:hypothetical protein
MIREPISMASTVEEVTVQKEPGKPVNSEHSFARWKAPLRPCDADV